MHIKLKRTKIYERRIDFRLEKLTLFRQSFFTSWFIDSIQSIKNSPKFTFVKIKEILNSDGSDPWGSLGMYVYVVGEQVYFLINGGGAKDSLMAREQGGNKKDITSKGRTFHISLRNSALVD